MAVIQILVTMEDAKGLDSVHAVNLSEGLLLTQYEGWAQAYALLVDAVTGGRVKRIGMGISFDLPGGLKATAVAGSDVEEGAKFQFATTTGFPTGFRIATFLESLISSNSRAVDLEDADVAALVDAIETGITVTATLIPPVDSRGDDVAALTSAKEQFQRSRA